MKSSKVAKYQTFLSHIGQVVVALGAVLTIAATGCDQGGEGARCVASLSHSDCNDGLTCTQPPSCPETYCCPATVTGTTNAYCQPGCAGGDQAIAAACAVNPAGLGCPAPSVPDGGSD